MQKKIAFYGKGGIGKSTTAANVSAAWAESGYQVCQIGCDPKNDSTRLLLGRVCSQTVLDMVKKYGEEVKTEQIVQRGFGGVHCVEAGGPEPGVGRGRPRHYCGSGKVESLAGFAGGCRHSV